MTSAVAPSPDAQRTLPATMRALVVLEPGRFEIQAVPVPEPGRDQVLARVRAVSICGTDVHLVRGDYPGFWPPSFPFIPGHEWAGEIVALGPGAERYGWRIGDRVAGTSHDACGVCQKCVEGRYNLCENYGKPGLHRQYGHNVQGADAEYVVHGVKAIFPLPAGLTFAEGAVIDPASIALHVANRAGVQPGDTVAITGGGAIGLLSADAARIRGAARVVIVEPSPGRRAKAEALGYETIDPGAVDPVERVRDITGGLGADVVLECAGVPVTVQWALAMLRKGGRCAAVGIPTKGVEIEMQRLVLDELELAGCRASAGEMRRVMPLVEQGRMRVRDVTTHRFDLADYGEAIRTFNDPASGAIKIIIEP
ncbi:MAG TPA: zinc-binding dehydrogenase [Candidatus Dormibacteraeota bacterium]|nr:zinc-binding dehydrogenase [Candidatus Dormibacteraeota bacterium]